MLKSSQICLTFPKYISMFESKGWCPYCTQISWRGLTPMQHDDDDQSKKEIEKVSTQ